MCIFKEKVNRKNDLFASEFSGANFFENFE